MSKTNETSGLNFLCLDLELNQPSNKIIQIGYVIGNILTGEVLHRRRDYINPGEELNPVITQLTGITEMNIRDLSIPMQDSYAIMSRLHTEYACHRNAITWGGGDSELLRKQLGLDDELFLLGRRWHDAKTLYIAYCLANGMKLQSGLAKSMTKLGMQFQGRKHDALDDAYNTFLVYHKLMQGMTEPKVLSKASAKNNTNGRQK